LNKKLSPQGDSDPQPNVLAAKCFLVLNRSLTGAEESVKSAGSHVAF
jgi:hypothetical protein